MPSIVFYQLDTESQDDINNIICDLCYSFYKNNRNIYILCPDLDYCHQLDEYIITYQKNNFFPYNLLGEGPIPPAQICIGHSETNKLKYDILINLHSIIPNNFTKYREIIELVAKNTTTRALSREHYKHYHKFSYNIVFTKDIKNIKGVEVINEQ
jgi:DNA polymerase-3 subunit chi